MKRRPLDIKKEILSLLQEYGQLSVRVLEKKVNTNYQTILNNCEELEYFGIVTMFNTSEGSMNGRAYRAVKLLRQL